MTTSQPHSETQDTLFGHPVGLFTLFFAEMWERFSYYGMRALLTFYMIKGFLGFQDDRAYRVYGAYTALVYMTPFFGGLISDRILGSRRSVILGGLLMAGGHLMMTVEQSTAFYFALALLICGNGFFKPNISTLVGSLYKPGSPARDGGFTIFYIGINLGAAMSPLLCGYIGETYGWHRGFGLATIGMLTGLAVFVAPNVLSQILLLVACCLTAFGLFGQSLISGYSVQQASDVASDVTQHAGASPLINAIVGAILVLVAIVSFVGLARQRKTVRGSWLSKAMSVTLIGGGALASAYGMLRLYDEQHLLTQLMNDPGGNVTGFIDVFVTICLLAAALVACIALAKGGLPVEAGAPSDPDRLRKRVAGILSVEWAVYLCALLSIPVFMLLVRGFDGNETQPATESTVTESLAKEQAPGIFSAVATVFVEEFLSPAGLCLLAASFGSLTYLIIELLRLQKVARERMLVALILTAFSILFWALFEQAGSSLNNFADRNIDRVSEKRRVTEEEVGTTIEIEPTQEQLGFHNGEQLFTLTDLTELRNENVSVNANFTIDWVVAEDNVGMGIASRNDEVAASVYQAVNPVFILILGLVFTALWGFLGSLSAEPSTPFKFALGLLQLGLGYAAFWYGAVLHDPRGMVFVGWLFLGYMLHTMGELCLSPVGLSMITRLSPRHLVGTMMGTWFLATALSQFLAGIIAQFTKVDSSGVIPAPIETVGKYGGVYGFLAAFAIGSAVVCFVLVPQLKRWMHQGEGVT